MGSSQGRESRSPKPNIPVKHDQPKPADVTEDHSPDGDPHTDLHETASFRMDATSPKHSTTAGKSIGPFRLQKCLGEGGMGSVWEAEQREPVRRRVALKLIKAGIGSKEVLVRFEAERRALAMMDHPNIARILDAGSGPDGQPWFAMELVQGIPLTRFCDVNRLDVARRLELFCDICSGVQHAHQKGIVHRDLKPGNIVIASIDGKPVPKIIDFGLAKAMESVGRLTDQTAQTSIGQILGTLKYMSPEQASFEAIDIDTRTDIYALGVILYELLVGVTPLDDQSVRGEPLIRVLERIREQEPVRPGARLRSLNPADLAKVVSQRQTDPAHLNRILVGDLDWIVLRALEKDRSRRYESAFGFQRDIRRFLDNEPVEARPPSRSYRMKKFVRKNRLFVTSASVVTATLLVGIFGTTWGLLAANSARIAESKRAEGERRANLESQARLAQIEEGNAVLGGIFDDLNLELAMADDDPLESILARRLVEAGRKLNADAVGDSLTTAKLKNQLAESLLNLGLAKESAALFEYALQRRQKLLGDDHPDTLASYSGVAESRVYEGRIAEALPTLEFVLQRRKHVLGTEHPDTLQSVNNLAETYRLLGRVDDAKKLFRELLDKSITVHGEHSRQTLFCQNNLAMALQSGGEVREAMELYEKTLANSIAILGADHKGTLTTMNNLAVACQELGMMPKALELYDRAFQLFTRKRGASHPDTLRAANNLAEAYRNVGRMPEALALFEKTVEAMIAQLGPENPDTLTCSQNLADTYFDVGNYEKAAQAYESTLAALEKNGTLAVRAIHLCSEGLASSYWANGELEKAEPGFQEILDRQAKELGRKNPATLSTMVNLGMIQRDLGQLDKSTRLLEEVAAMVPQFPALAYVRPELRTAYLKAGRMDEVAAMLAVDIAETRRSMPAGSIELASALNALGFDYVGIGDFEAAVPLLRESLKIRQEKMPGDWRTFNTQSLLGEAVMGKVLAANDATPEPDRKPAEVLFAEASTLMLAGYHGLKSVQESIPTVSRALRLHQALDRLIGLAKQSGDEAAEKRWAEERESLNGRATGDL